jgi:mRNA interferase RelE/StbE
VSAYRIELRPAAVRALRKLDPQVRHRVQGAIALLEDDVLLVVVVRLGNRRDVYDK